MYIDTVKLKAFLDFDAYVLKQKKNFNKAQITKNDTYDFKSDTKTFFYSRTDFSLSLNRNYGIKGRTHTFLLVNFIALFFISIMTYY